MLLLSLEQNLAKITTDGALSASIPSRRAKNEMAAPLIPRFVLENKDALACYPSWEAPTCIISDGPYGLGKFPGEPKTPRGLAEWYAPHAAAWYDRAAPNCTLWFWCTELAWAIVHPVLELHGWEYQEACIWDKGIAHVAGNCNSKTIRGVPVVTEIAVRYTKRQTLLSVEQENLSVKDWVRAEWLRSGLPMNQANAACGVKNAATRKYLTQCDLWYWPPGDAVEKMATYCTRHGAKTSVPYFSIDRSTPVTAEAWDNLRAKWHHEHGLSNVWAAPSVHGPERQKSINGGYLHANQKPLSLMRRQLELSTDEGDVVWEPFGGLCSASLAALQLNRRPFACDFNKEFFEASFRRLSEVAA